MSTSIVARCAVLMVSAVFSMPFLTDASHVRGGDDVSTCDTTALNPTGSCAALKGKTCKLNKAVCYACTGQNQMKEFKCGPSTDAACGDPANCVAGQKDASLSPDNCIAVNCP